MNKIHLNINIETLNLLLIFVGFPAFTSIVNSSIGSIVYRGVAMAIALICIIKNRFRIHDLRNNKSLILFLVLYVLLTVRMVYEMYFGSDASTDYINSRNFVMLFTFGIGWIPFLGAVCGFDNIKKDKIIIYSFWILIAIIVMGIIEKDVNTTEMGRVALNARQSTLAFGDNGAYLAIISGCILLNRNKLKKYYTYFAIAGLLIGIYATLIAGSRGPFISCLVGLLFVLSMTPTRINLIVIATILVGIIGGTLNMKFIERISPTMSNRMERTIDKGDTSGRDILFKEAWEKINVDYLGANPIILEPHGTFTGYHNVYLGTGVGTGIFGFFTFILLVISLLFRSLKNRLKFASLFDVAIFSLFWFYAMRGITGVGMLTNTMYTVLFAFTCIILHCKIYTHDKLIN